MRLLFLLLLAFCLTETSCKKTVNKLNSKTDYIPIISTSTPGNLILGQEIKSQVKMGFHSYNAHVTFLNFEIKETATREYYIRAKGLYENINYEIDLPVVSTFDTTLSIRPNVTGQYLLRFYSSSQLVQTDTVQVN